MVPEVVPWLHGSKRHLAAEVGTAAEGNIFNYSIKGEGHELKEK